MAERADYIKTGNSALTRFGNKLSVIPLVGSFIATPFLTVGLLMDSGKWLMRGKIGSAATELATGTLSAGLNIATGPLWWLGKVASVGFTQHTVGTHGRAVAESVIGGVTGALGMKPQVLRSYAAGVGAIPGAGMYYQQQAPGYWATRAAQEQGQDPSQRWQQYRNGDGRDHVAALQDAALRPQTRGI
ncbi:MAG: hypothetical protein C0436_05705 [Alphaproteobacteria bacterium]|nr:hypothetical protein [Alphaproteobacteria bacterium]